MEQLISILIIIHAVTGGIALTFGFIPLVVKKGSKTHKKSGVVFFFAMAISMLTALIVSVSPGHHNAFLFGIGIFSTYLLIIGFRSTAYKNTAISLTGDKIVAAIMILSGLGMIFIPILIYGKILIVLAVFGLVGIGFATQDLLLFRNRKKMQSNYLMIHITRMTGAYIAAVSGFLVVNNIFVHWINWFGPGIIGGVFIYYWMRKINRKTKVKKSAMLILCLGVFSTFSFGQIYIEKQTRHRFAQMTLGVDAQTSFGGKTYFLNSDGIKASMDLGQIYKPRFIIGGTHFWGHADFYITIPLLYPKQKENNQEINFTSGVETVFKYYPWRIEHNKIRPFIGLSLAPFFYSQDNNNLNFGKGPQLSHTTLPLVTGFTFNNRNHLFELNLTYNYANQKDYYISKTDLVEIETPPFYLAMSYKYMFDTTIGAEKDWESGETNRITEKLAAAKKLDGFFIGAGMSSAWWMGNSDYNKSERPYFQGYGVSLMVDYTLGYHIFKPDINIALCYRGYGINMDTYGVVHRLKRRSLGIEATKYLGDYHGFAPFVGPIVSYENLAFKEAIENNQSINVMDKRLTFGFTFGWDIRPNRLQSFILRTNLRYFPNLKLEVSEGKSVSFNNLEFNFIQLIIYPGRMF